MTLTMKFAEVLYAARDAKKLTQSQVAEAISISVRWYQKVEAGLRLPSTIPAIKLMLFLDIDIEELREASRLPKLDDQKHKDFAKI